MSKIHLMMLWHMHQPQYRDPATRRYVLPWTRLHALKDYWGMVRVLREFPGVHATFNVVPSLGMQLEEYASGNFSEPWFDIAFRSAAELSVENKTEILLRAFQLNHDHLMARWPRFVELYEWVQAQGDQRAVQIFGERDWRDLQVLSQLAWMDEEYLASDEVVRALAAKGADYTEDDQKRLREKQLELLARVLPEYRAAAATGQRYRRPPFIIQYCPWCAIPTWRGSRIRQRRCPNPRSATLKTPWSSSYARGIITSVFLDSCLTACGPPKVRYRRRR